MTDDAGTIASELIAALNARDFSAVAALADEDVAVAGIGEWSDIGRDALRDRLSRHFAASGETYGDVVVMRADGGTPVAIRVTARGAAASGAAYAAEKVLLLEVDEGRITRLSLLADAGEILRQIGR